MSGIVDLGRECTFVFGKRKPFEDGVVREYEKLHIGENLSREALDLLDSLCRQFCWRGVGGGVWEPVLAVAALSNPSRMVLARILDDGPDNKNRPHLLRIEAFEANLEKEKAKEYLGAFLEPRAWSIDAPDFRMQKNGFQNPAPLDFDWKSEDQTGKWTIHGDPGSYVYQGKYSGDKKSGNIKHNKYEILKITNEEAEAKKTTNSNLKDGLEKKYNIAGRTVRFFAAISVFVNIISVSAIWVCKVKIEDLENKKNQLSKELSQEKNKSEKSEKVLDKQRELQSLTNKFLEDLQKISQESLEKNLNSGQNNRTNDSNPKAVTEKEQKPNNFNVYEMLNFKTFFSRHRLNMRFLIELENIK